MKSESPKVLFQINGECLCWGPLEALLAGRCKYCGNDVSTGAFDWVVSFVKILESHESPPLLTAHVDEESAELETVVDPKARERLTKLRTRDPDFTGAGFRARVRHVFETFQASWSARDLAAMRPYLSDALFTMQTYWVREYERQGLRNVTDDATLVRADLAHVGSDEYFDAITMRIFARSLDYTVTDDSGKLVSGSRDDAREYSEYWTFIRSRDAKGRARVDHVCPRCGAPLAIAMSGHCTHCEAKVTSGRFDWVLSRIEQDEVYSG